MEKKSSQVLFVKHSFFPCSIDWSTRSSIAQSSTNSGPFMGYTWKQQYGPVLT